MYDNFGALVSFCWPFTDEVANVVTFGVTLRAVLNTGSRRWSIKKHPPLKLPLH